MPESACGLANATKSSATMQMLDADMAIHVRPGFIQVALLPSEDV